MASKNYLPNLRNTKDRARHVSLIGETLDTESYASIIDFSLKITVLLCKSVGKFNVLKSMLISLSKQSG